MSCFIANGRYCGGGMQVGKGGSMQDRLLDMTRLPQTTIGAQLLQARRLYDGSLNPVAGAESGPISTLKRIP